MTNIPWRTSTHSQSSGGQCIEVGPVIDHSGRIAVRDTKHRQGPTLTTAAPEWAGFLAALQNAHFDT